MNTLADGSSIRDFPFFSRFSKEIEQELIPAFIEQNFKRDDVSSRGKKSGNIAYIWPLFLQQSNSFLLSIEIHVGSLFDPRISISGSVFKIANPADEEAALSQIHAPNPETGRPWPPLGHIRTVNLFERSISPYNRWKMIGFLPADIGKRAAKYIPVFGRVFHLLMILLTIPTALLTLPIRKWAIRKEEIWIKSPIEKTEGDRQKQIQSAKEEIPNMLKKLQEIAGQS